VRVSKRKNPRSSAGLGQEWNRSAFNPFWINYVDVLNPF
jgi:hypothetical protein